MKKLLGLIGAVLGIVCNVEAATFLKVSDYPNTNNLASNQLFWVTAGATNMNVSYGQLTALQSNAIRTYGATLYNRAADIAWTTTNFNGSNTYGGVVTIPTGMNVVSITNNHINTNSMCVAVISSTGCASNLVAVCTANLLTLAVDNTAVTNCLVRWLLLAP